jgi:hypothetical protein
MALGDAERDLSRYNLSALIDGLKGSRDDAGIRLGIGRLPRSGRPVPSG